MSRHTLGLAFFLIAAFASSSFGQAVTSGTGAINGRVTDATQAVMPGVTVTVTGPALMGARTDLTDADGQYRFTAVPPGEYTLLANFSQRDVHVPLEGTMETVLTTHHATLEPGFVVLPALSGALLK